MSQVRAEVPATVEPPRPLPGGTVAVGLVAFLWAAFIAFYLDHRIVLSPDSMNNYAHVWWIADRLWGHASFPLHMPVLGHGHALTFPYGLPNWTAGALLHPLFGDWAVTLMSVLGALASVAATFFAFSELRRGWWAAAVLANPAIIASLMLGQQSFAWGGALLLFGIGCWRRGRHLPAALLVGLAMATHPPGVLPMVVIVGAWWYRYEPDRGALTRWAAVSLVLAAPAVIAVFASPVYADSTLGDKVFSFFSTLAPRSLIVVLPVVFAVAAHAHRRWLAPTALGLALFLNVGMGGPLRIPNTWRQMHRNPAASTATLRGFLASSDFQPGPTYRVLRGTGDAKLGLYLVLKAGGRLDSEFFPESMAIRSFGSSADYERLLCRRNVDAVLAFDSYTRARHTNEEQLLKSLAAGGGAGLVQVRTSAVGPDYTLYTVSRSRCPG